MKETTIIIQGKLTVYTITSIYKHKDDYNIVVVTPKSSDSKLLEECSRICIEIPNCSLIVYDEELILNTKYNNVQNRYYHFASTWMGLQCTHSKYSIKLRSDEYYSNFDPLIEKIKNNPLKIVTNDVFFRKFSCRPFHPSDHLVAGKTELMKRVFLLAKEYSESDKLGRSPWVRSTDMISAENQLCFAIFDAKHEIPESKDDYQLMIDNVDMVMSEDLGFFRVRWNSSSKEFFDSSFYDPNTDIKTMKDLIA
jgi:hypothetical protein